MDLWCTTIYKIKDVKTGRDPKIIRILTKYIHAFQLAKVLNYGIIGSLFVLVASTLHATSRHRLINNKHTIVK